LPQEHRQIQSINSANRGHPRAAPPLLAGPGTRNWKGHHDVPPRKRNGKLTGRGSLDANASPAEQDAFRDDHRRGLLSLRVPLSATLVAKRQSIAQLSALAPGMILRLDTPCTAAIELRVAGKTIARGHCICQGQRLGLLLADRA
jgi:flagellar motor switch/type III secretory pathway protein FliN